MPRLVPGARVLVGCSQHWDMGWDTERGQGAPGLSPLCCGCSLSVLGDTRMGSLAQHTGGGAPGTGGMDHQEQLVGSEPPHIPEPAEPLQPRRGPGAAPLHHPLRSPSHKPHPDPGLAPWVHSQPLPSPCDGSLPCSADMGSFEDSETQQSVSHGEAAVIRAPRIASFPQPQVTWFRDGRKISPSSRM